MGITPPPDTQRVSEWERGVHVPDERNMRALSEAVDHEIAWFYADEPDETPDLVETLNGDATQLDRIEKKLDQLLAAIARPAAGKHPPPPGELGRDAKDSTPTTAHPPQPQKKRAPGKRSDSA